MVTTNTEEKCAVQHSVISRKSYFNDSLWNKILITVETHIRYEDFNITCISGPVRANLGATDMCFDARHVSILNNILGVYLTTLLLFKTLVHTRSFRRSEWL